jgi:hypothetical protein
MIKKFALLIGVILLQMSCSKKMDCCVIIDTGVRIHYITANGTNLINSSDEYTEENIKIFYKKDGEYEYPYQGNLDYPNMHFVDTTLNGEIILTVFANSNFEGNYSETIIELNERTRDTMRCEFDLTNGDQTATKVWYNGQLMDGTNFEVIKE